MGPPYVVGALTNPEPHIGKTYHPTGPQLLSPEEIATTFGKVLGRKVIYQNASLKLFLKVAKALDYPVFQIARGRSKEFAAAITEALPEASLVADRWLAQEHGLYAGLRKPRRSPLDWATQYVRERWEAGERNGTVLWEELKTQGYSGIDEECLSPSGYMAGSPAEARKPDSVRLSGFSAIGSRKNCRDDLYRLSSCYVTTTIPVISKGCS